MTKYRWVLDRDIHEEMNVWGLTWKTENGLHHGVFHGPGYGSPFSAGLNMDEIMWRIPVEEQTETKPRTLFRHLNSQKRGQ